LLVACAPTLAAMPSGFNYSKWDNIEESDDEADLHPNIDKDSWVRLQHRNRVEREEDEVLVRQKLDARLAVLKKDYAGFPEAARAHMKAQKVKKELDEVEAQCEKLDRERKWNVDNMCKTAESRTEVSAPTATPKPEPRLQGEAVAAGYCEFVEENEELLEKYIAMGDAELEQVMEFLKVHGGKLLVGEHAESYLLLDCLEKEMNGEHAAMKRASRQSQFLTQLREFSRAAGRPVRDGVHPVFQRLMDHEGTSESFDEAVAQFVDRVEKRAVVKKKEMDKEGAEAEDEEDGPINPIGPGGLDPMDVFKTLPGDMQMAFQAKDMQALNAAVEALPAKEAKYHLKRCEDSGLWCPNPEAGVAPYREDSDSDGDPP